MVMKKFFCIALSLMLLLLTVGCASAEIKILENESYALMECNGVYTLRFHEPLPDKDKGNVNLSSPGGTYIKFDTVKKMKEAIETGNFTEKQLDTIRNYFTRKNGEILSVNPNELYEAALPEDMVATEVTWNGDDYSFTVKSKLDEDISGRLEFDTKEEHDQHKQKMTEFLEINDDVVQYKVEERDATVYEYKSSFGLSMRIVMYTLQSDGKTVMVHETYRMSGTEAKFQGVWLCGEQAGAYFYADIDCASRPSVEWLLSIGLKPYVETAIQ